MMISHASLTQSLNSMDIQFVLFFLLTNLTKHFLEKGPILAVSFSSNGQWVVSGSRSGHHSVRVLDVRNGDWVCILKGHVDDVWTLDFSPAGSYLVSGSNEGLVRLWRYEALE